jgi:hypothetical protein
VRGPDEAALKPAQRGGVLVGESQQIRAGREGLAGGKPPPDEFDEVAEGHEDARDGTLRAPGVEVEHHRVAPQPLVVAFQVFGEGLEQAAETARAAGINHPHRSRPCRQMRTVFIIVRLIAY